MDLFILKTWLDAKFHKGEEGASLTEYALLVALIAVVAIGAVWFLGRQVDSKLSSAGSAVSGN